MKPPTARENIRGFQLCREAPAELPCPADGLSFSHHGQTTTHRHHHGWRRQPRLESRVTILGYVQRGGTPSPADRLLATRLGAACTGFIREGISGVMVAARGDKAEPVPLEKAAGKLKTVPLDHDWIETARRVGTCLGD